MQPVFTAAEMRAVDARAIEALGIPGATLMDRAGTGAAELIARRFAPIRGRRVAIVCGKGNNGGDGFVVARRLRARGARVDVLLVARRDEVAGDAAGALGRWRGPVREIPSGLDPGALARELARADLVVDALLGTGLAGAARGNSALAIEAINAAGRPVVALDLPSGLGSDAGGLIGPAVQAQVTATFAGYKRSLIEYPAAGYAGHVRVVDIGVPADEAARGIRTFLLEEADVRPHFPPRRRDAHKGSYGHVLIVAGSVGKTGAAALAGRAALRSGVGLCTIASPASQQPIVAALGMEHMTEPLAETPGQALAWNARDRVLELAARVDAVALGPGISLDPETQELVRALVVEVGRPMVVDADGLNALARDLTVLTRAAGPRVLTPHPGEMSRLLGVATAAIQQDRIETSRRFAASQGVHVALKGAGTVIAGPDGRVFVNPTGNPGMASGGSGDVLTGMIGAFLARGLDPLSAIQSGCFLHGRAGDLAAAARGEDGLVAGDILDAIPAAIRSLRGPGPR
jgi:NAD(P)H-hydrate epimerase